MRLVSLTAFLLTVFALLAITPAAQAAFVAPSQWARGTDVRSTYQEWDRFDTPAGPNAPNSPNVPVAAAVAAAPFNTAGVANLVDTSGGSFVTSGGNIYSPTAVVSVDATVPNFDAPTAQWTTVVLQTRTQGTAVDLSTVQLTADSVVYQPIDSALVFTQVLGGFGGTLEDRWFQFVVPGNSASYLIEFNAPSSSMSLDKVSVDTFWTAAQTPIVEPNPVPEPATWLTLLCGGLALLVGRFLRK